MESTTRCPYCAEEILLAAIKCKHCGSALIESVPAYDPIIGPPLVSDPKFPLQKSIWARPAHQTWIFWLIVVIFLVIKASNFFESSTSNQATPSTTTPDVTPQTTAPAPKLPELTAVIETNGAIVTVKNDDTFSWQDCEAIINGGFSGFALEFGDVSPNQTLSLATTQFADGSERFNPYSTKVLSIVIACTTRDGKQYASARYE
jgi:hypothetical protein